MPDHPSVRKDVGRVLVVRDERFLCPQCGNDICGIFEMVNEKSGISVKLLDFGGIVESSMAGRCKGCNEQLYWNTSHQMLGRLLEAVAEMQENAVKDL